MSNDALKVNEGIDGSAQIAITPHGSDWYWTVFAIMVVSTFVFLGLGYMKPQSHRIFHYITASITMVAAIAYFSMAADLGQAPITVEFMRDAETVAGSTREIFYARYIDWVVTTPLLLLDLLLTSGLPWPTVLATVLLDEVMIVTGLIGALTRTSYKWGFFTFGCLALLGVVYTLLFPARQSAMAIGKDVHRAYIIVGVWTAFLWFLYPIAWGVSEGGNVIAPDSEAVFYGILDVLAKPVFGALLLWGHRGIDPIRLGLRKPDPTTDAAHYKKTDEVTGITSRTNNNTPGTGTHESVVPQHETHNSVMQQHGTHNATVPQDGNYSSAPGHQHNNTVMT